MASLADRGTNRDKFATYAEALDAADRKEDEDELGRRYEIIREGDGYGLRLDCGEDASA